MGIISDVTIGGYYAYSGETLQNVTSKPTAGGYVYYNSSTGVLELNNIIITMDETGSAISIDEGESERKSTLTIRVTGNSQINTAREALIGQSVNCTITGTGAGTDTLTLQTNQGRAADFYSLTVESNVTLEAASEGTAEVIMAKEDIVLKGKVTAIGDSAYSAISSSNGKIEISGGSVTATADTFAISGGKDIEIKNATVQATVTAGTAIASPNVLRIENSDVNATASSSALQGDDGVKIKGGTFTATSTSNAAIYSSSGKIEIESGSVTADGPYGALKGETGVEIKGGTVMASAPESMAIYAPSGKIKIEGGSVTATGDFDALAGGTGVEISGGVVRATAEDDSAIFSGDTLCISGGDVTAQVQTSYYAGAICAWEDLTISGGNVTAIAPQYNAMVCYGTLDVTGGTLAVNGGINAKTILNGNAVMYMNDDYLPDTIIKGVLYQNVDVSLDEKDNTVLKGGNGTVYGTPQFASFETLKPQGSTLKYALNQTTTPPKTGDSSRVALWTVMMAISAAGVAVALSARKRCAK